MKPNLAKILSYLIMSFLVFLVIIIFQVVSNGGFVQFDYYLVEIVNQMRQPIFTKIFYLFTLLGLWPFVVVLSLIFLSFFWYINKKNYIIPYIIVVSGSSLLGVLGKFIFLRPRPDLVNQLYPETYLFIHSFPSIHAVYAVSLLGFLIYFTSDFVEKRAWQNIVQILCIICIFAIGFSRLYLGVHFFSDVLAGYLLGAIWLLFVLFVWEKKKR